MQAQSWGPAPTAPALPDTSVRPVLPRPVDPDVAPRILVRVFGEPTVEGGDDLPPGTPLSVEIVTFIALTGSVTPRAMASAVWPYGVTSAERDATLSRVGSWLGTDAAGRPRLRLDEGRLSLSDDLQLDWHRFVALAERATDADVLLALELARGPLAEPHQARRYTWLARNPVTHELPAYVTDVAHRLARSYQSRGEFDGAAAASRAGLRVDLTAEVLWDDLTAAIRDRDGEAAAQRVADERTAALTGTAVPNPATTTRISA